MGELELLAALCKGVPQAGHWFSQDGEASRVPPEKPHMCSAALAAERADGEGGKSAVWEHSHIC